MAEKRDQLTALIGASRAVEELGRSLSASGVRHAAAASHLRGLRRDLLLRNVDVVVLLVALDRATLNRYGRPLRTLLSDLHTLSGDVYSVGVLADEQDPRSLDELGCDMYVTGPAEATRLVRYLMRRSATTAAKRRGGRRVLNAGGPAPRRARRRSARQPGEARWLDAGASGRPGPD